MAGILVAGLAPSCAHGPAERPATPRTAWLDDARVPIVAPTTSEANAFAASIATILAEGDFRALDALTDARTFQSRVWGHIEVAAETRREAARALESTLAEGRLLGQFARVAGDTPVRVAILGVTTQGALTYVSSRIEIADEDVNWFELLLTRTPEGVRVADFYDMGSGRWLSERCRRTFVQEIAARDASFGGDLPPDEQPWLRRSSDVAELLRVVKTTELDAAELISKHDALPLEIRSSQSFVLDFLEAAHASPYPEVRAKAAASARELSRVQADVNVRWFEYAAVSGDHDEALAALDRLAKRLGDPYLDVERGRAYLGKRMPRAATEHLERALAIDPTLDRAYRLELEVYLYEEDMSAAVRVLDAFRKARLRPPVVRERVLSKLAGRRPTFDVSALRSSKEYQAWVASD